MNITKRQLLFFLNEVNIVTSNSNKLQCTQETRTKVCIFGNDCHHPKKKAKNKLTTCISKQNNTNVILYLTPKGT